MAEKTLSTNALLHGIEIRSPIEENIKPLLNYSQFRMLKQMKYNWNKKSLKSGKTSKIRNFSGFSGTSGISDTDTPYPHPQPHPHPI